MRINACRSGRFRWVLVVPAFDEDVDCIETLTQHLNFDPNTKSLLVICVLNAPDDASGSAIARTRATLPDAIRPDSAPEEIRDGVSVLWIDAVTEPLPADQATGLARKIGNDIACQLIAQGHISTPILCNTDADAVLPSDYFSRITRARAQSNNTEATAAWVLPFEHSSPNPELQQAGTVYELYLRALQLNLQRCGSPYAYPALGSVLAIDPVYYAKSRGFPKRRAGEDFYLLNKLAKLAEVTYLTGLPIRLAARTSPRVPFGTGPAITKLVNADPVKSNRKNTHPCDLLETYALESFALLRQFYEGIRELDANKQPTKPSPATPKLTTRKLPKAWQDPDLLWLLKRLGVPAALDRLQTNHRSTPHLQRAVHEWFDALKTVRFLNEARHFHADEPLIAQIEQLQTFLPADHELNKIGRFTSATKEPAPDDRWQKVSTLNLELERYRSTTRHSVARSVANSVADCLT